LEFDKILDWVRRSTCGPDIKEVRMGTIVTLIYLGVGRPELFVQLDDYSGRGMNN
jgi:hypothetical protein